MVNPIEQEVQLSFDFACCHCGDPMGVTLQCGGQGLTYGKEPTNSIASASVPCQGCGQVNQLVFDPTGTLLSVQPRRCYWPVPGPSVN